ncbi:sentrin-specific protease 7-like isoform X1, partial [Lates japonicus]
MRRPQIKRVQISRTAAAGFYGLQTRNQVCSSRAEPESGSATTPAGPLSFLQLEFTPPPRRLMTPTTETYGAEELMTAGIQLRLRKAFGTEAWLRRALLAGSEASAAAVFPVGDDARANLHRELSAAGAPPPSASASSSAGQNQAANQTVAPAARQSRAVRGGLRGPLHDDYAGSEIIYAGKTPIARTPWNTGVREFSVVSVSHHWGADRAPLSGISSWREGGVVRAESPSSAAFLQTAEQTESGREDDASVPDRHMRHQRVKTWTRHVDIFTKDFLFVPVNQEAHWYLVVVCFPGLEESQYEDFERRTGGSEQTTGNTNFSLRTQQPPECTQQGWQRDTVTRRPCILVMDSLKLSYHENVCRLLRDYLQVEWEVRRRTPRLFTSDNMRSSNCRVPQQDNSSDCGLYLLQYVESFLQNPVVHFDLPLCLTNWFPRQRVRQKREEIRRLIMRMHQSQRVIHSDRSIVKTTWLTPGFLNADYASRDLNVDSEEHGGHLGEPMVDSDQLLYRRHAALTRRKRDILFPSGVKLCTQETFDQAVVNHLYYFHLRVCQETVWEAFKIFWDRLPDRDEYQDWVGRCKNGSISVMDIGSFFSQSEEHISLIKSRVAMATAKN